jgi:OmpA-OmpF porin, OOP family
MRCNPWRWLWGLIPIAMLTAGANMTERAGIEADLSLRAKQAFERQGFSWADVSFEGRDAVLTGRAAEDDEPRKALEQLTRTWGVRVAKSRTDLVAKVDAYSWAAAVDGKTVTLSGYTPSDETRRAIIGVVKANFPKAAIKDDMTIARGAPKRDVWIGGVGFGLKQLAGLKRGSVKLDGTVLSIAGEAADGASYKAIRAAVPAQLPKTWTLGTAQISAPAVSPFTWSAKYSGSQLVLSGYVPDEKTRDSLFAFAKKTFPKIALVDRLEIAGGAPEAWLATAEAGLDQLYQLKDGTAEMRGKEILLTGTAEDEPSAQAVRDGLKTGAAPGYKVSHAIKVPAQQAAAVSPYVTTVAVQDGAINLTGYVPSEAARSVLLAAVRARFGGRTVNDRLSVAAGAASGWETCALAGIAELGRLDAGQAALTDGKLVLSGLTSSASSALAVPGELRAAAGSACQADARIDVTQAPSAHYWWTATRAADGLIVLEGDAPDASARAELTRAAEGTFGSGRVDDRMTVVSKRLDTWPKVTASALKMLAGLDAGVASVFGDDVSVRGIAASDAAAASVRALVTSDLPSGFRGREQITVRDDRAQRDADARRKADAAAQAAAEAKRDAAAADAASRARKQQSARACQDDLMAAAAESGINFGRASADLSKSSSPTLNKLAKIANGCPDTRIEISGHTDSEGIPERNNPLSERRAKAVLTYLTGAGVAASRLSAAGYGAEKPIAPNETAEGRAKNRRIEFAVVPN